LWSLRVHLLTKDERVELRRVADDALICKAPCDAELRFHDSDEFVLGGQGVARSNIFHFRRREGDITLRVDSGSDAPKYGGAALLGVGGAIAIFGGFLAAGQGAGAALCEGPSCPGRSSSGGTLALVGLGMAVAGGLLIGFSQRTTYSVVE
jgi:hypothetical protein